jgi:hypothetical protein
MMAPASASSSARGSMSSGWKHFVEAMMVSLQHALG